MTCIAVSVYLQDCYKKRLSANTSRSALERLVSLSCFGGYRPIVVARLPYTAKNKDRLLSQPLVDIAVPLQEFKHALLRFA